MISILSNIRVLDLSTVLAGPSVGSFLAEQGASVLKIEHPELKDVTRTWKTTNEKKESSVSNYYSSVNSMKEVSFKDFQNAIDLDFVKEEISKCDILLSNFKKGDAEKFGLEDEKLKKIHPTIIHGKISGFGINSDRIAYDLILQAETGFMHMNGQADGPPTKMPVALIDVLAGHHLKEGILLALLNKKEGEMQIIEVSLYDAAISSLMNQASNYLMGNSIPERIGSLHPNIAPYGEIFKTDDHKQVTFAIGSERHFERLIKVLNLPCELVNHHKFSSNQNRVANRLELANLISERVNKFSSEELESRCAKEFVPFGIIKNLEEVFRNKDAQNLILEENMEGLSTKKIKSFVGKWTMK